MSPTLKFTVWLLGIAAVLLLVTRAVQDAIYQRSRFPVQQVQGFDTAAVWDSLTRR